MSGFVSTALSINIVAGGQWSSTMIVFQLPSHVDLEAFTLSFQVLLQEVFAAAGKNIEADAIVMAAIAAMQCKMPFDFIATKADKVSVIHLDS